jgi:hypothetical protein
LVKQTEPHQTLHDKKSQKENRHHRNSIADSSTEKQNRTHTAVVDTEIIQEKDRNRKSQGNGAVVKLSKHPLVKQNSNVSSNSEFTSSSQCENNVKHLIVPHQHEESNQSRDLSDDSETLNKLTYSPRHAPKIVYSHSEDHPRVDRRSIFGSPSSSPRLRRQPTMETRRVSVSDNDGYTQLNQYKLKSEIGKVKFNLVHYMLFRFWTGYLMSHSQLQIKYPVSLDEVYINWKMGR